MSAPSPLPHRLSDAERSLVEKIPKDLYVGGRWRPAASGRTFDVEDPATGEILTQVADADSADALEALDAACEAAASWAKTPPRQRSELLRRAFELMGERAEDLAVIMTLEMGKPLAESRAEVAYAAEFFRWFSEEAVRTQGGYRVAPGGGSRLVELREAVGPSLLITPWNFPLAMATRKLGPALAAGCSAVLKPAELTPLCALALAEILAEAGAPPGVVNVVCTSQPAEVADPLLADHRLRKLSFTGSTAVGRRLIAASAQGVLRVSMELGGNAAFIVFEDADFEAALSGAMVAKMRNGGEACTSANRFLVHQSLAADFAAALAERMSALVVGHGCEPGVGLGPLINQAQRLKVAELVEEAITKGARPLCGATALEGPGYFYAPTVLVDVPPDARLLREEIFGPVAPVVSFASEQEALALANDTEYGLVGYLYTRDLGRALRVAEGLETGMVGINSGLVSNPAAPFGGVKASGFGREGGREGLEEYLEVKYLNIAL